MIATQHDERRRRGLLTQQEVCDLADCTHGRLQYHARRGWIEAPDSRLGSRVFYSENLARRIADYFRSRTLWERRTRKDEDG